jgi:hypothetical protein
MTTQDRCLIYTAVDRNAWHKATTSPHTGRPGEIEELIGIGSKVTAVVPLPISDHDRELFPDMFSLLIFYRMKVPS